MKHWIYYISSIEYTTYKALKKQWDWFCKSDSYFALFENFDETLNKFKKNDTGFAYNNNSNSLLLCASDTDFLFCCCRFMQLVIAENKRVKWKEYKEMRKWEHEREKLFDWKRLFAQTIDVIDQWKDIKQRLWSRYM